MVWGSDPGMAAKPDCSSGRTVAKIKSLPIHGGGLLTRKLQLPVLFSENLYL